MEEGLPSFSSLQGSVQDAASKVLELNLQGQQYSTSSVQEWSEAICAQTVAALRNISGSFKYTATCVLTQKTGGGLHTSSAACWEPASDGHRFGLCKRESVPMPLDESCEVWPRRVRACGGGVWVRRDEPSKPPAARKNKGLL